MVSPKKAAPVQWYSPSQLLRTGAEVLATSLFGRRADLRRLSALGPKDQVFEPPPREHEGELWLDFCADCGDGFGATFSVAQALAGDLVVDTGEPAPLLLRAGQVLVLGGDQVYPTPSRGAYDERFLGPYQNVPARAHGPAVRHLYAVPGNHDWYDGLVEFSRVFCTQSTIGPWTTRQHRSYFALRLSPALWLFAVDTQICQDIDRDQLDYFRAILTDWRDSDETPGQLVMVTAEPHWEAVDFARERRPRIKRVDIQGLGSRHLLGTLLTEIEKHGAELVVQLTGDLHHYRRYATTDQRRHLITAGGGGAFTHPTHTRVDDHNPTRRWIGKNQDELVEDYHWQGADFPSPRQSAALSLRNLAFGLYNWRFVPVLGALYLLLGIVMPRPTQTTPLLLLCETFENLVLRPGSACVALAVVAAVVAFTDTTHTLYRWCAGAVHAAAHLVGALLVVRTISWLTAQYATKALLFSWLVERQLLRGAGVFLAGCLVGSTLWGLYLYISVNVFKRHSNEAFSSLRIQDYKSFVRMRLTASTLTLYPLGLQKTPRNRHWTWSDIRSTWTSEEPLAWKLLEPPITLALRAPSGVGAPLE
jgi:hypothetical protein